MVAKENNYDKGHLQKKPDQTEMYNSSYTVVCLLLNVN